MSEDTLSREPMALQLRYLQTLADIAGGDKSSTTIFPVPLDLIRPFFEHMTAAPVGKTAPSDGEDG